MLFYIKDEETLLNVMKSVTKNAKSILLTAVFAMILVYIFAFVGFIFFRDDFVIEAEKLQEIESKSSAADKYKGSAQSIYLYRQKGIVRYLYFKF